MFGNKKKIKEFEATKTFMVDRFQYDENRGLIKIKNGFQVNIIPIDTIETYSLTYGNKTYDKTNISRAVIGGALFGILGILTAGTHKEEYISNMTIMIKANGKFYYLPLIIGKVKYDRAKEMLQRAEKIIAFLDEITN